MDEASPMTRDTESADRPSREESNQMNPYFLSLLSLRASHITSIELHLNQPRTLKEDKEKIVVFLEFLIKSITHKIKNNITR